MLITWVNVDLFYPIINYHNKLPTSTWLLPRPKLDFSGFNRSSLGIFMCIRERSSTLVEMARTVRFVCVYILTAFAFSQIFAKDEEEDEAPTGIRSPSMCEVCKYLAVELQGRLDETGKSREVIETGHGIEPEKRKKKEYKKSELRLIEAVNEPHVCDRILEYNVHAERKKSLRYAKGQSQTMQTLHNLVNKGVKVELGIPYELWDQPSAEVTDMQRKCFKLVEEHEEDIEDWYYGSQEKPLIDFLCRDRILTDTDQACLTETFIPEEETDKEPSENKSDNLKGDPGTEESHKPTPDTDDKDEL